MIFYLLKNERLFMNSDKKRRNTFYEYNIKNESQKNLIEEARSLLKETRNELLEIKDIGYANIILSMLIKLFQN